MCLQGNIKNIKVNKRFNTNNIIKNIYDMIDNKHKHKNIFNIGNAGNPLLYYNSIFEYLLDNDSSNPISSINLINMTPNEIDLKLRKLNINPKVIFLQFYSHKNLEKYKNINVNDKKYVLDSVTLISTNNEHFSCYITCNKKDYGFDGGSNQPLQKFKWKDKINKNINFKFKNIPKDIKFNFTNGYSIYVYYRI